LDLRFRKRLEALVYDEVETVWEKGFSRKVCNSMPCKESTEADRLTQVYLQNGKIL